jgi:hypothetical protein
LLGVCALALALGVAIPAIATGVGTAAKPALLSAAGKPTEIPNRLLVKFSSSNLPRVSALAMNPLSTVVPLSATSHSIGHGTYALSFRSAADMQSSIDALRKLPGFQYAEPVYLYYPLGTAYTSTPNDVDFSSTGTVPSTMGSYDTTDFPSTRNWWIKGPLSPQNDQVWGKLADATKPAQAPASDFTVGLIDSGYYFAHPDTGNIVAGWDFIDSYSYFNDTYVQDGDVAPSESTDWMSAAHGTCTAGEIAAATNNGTGNASVGFDDRVLVYKVAGPISDGVPGFLPAGYVIITDQAIGDAIYRAVDDGCKVISMSIGGGSDSRYIDDAITYAQQHDVLLVFAAGNEGISGLSYPSSVPGVLSVGSYGFWKPDTMSSPDSEESVVDTGALDPSTGLVRSAFSNYPSTDPELDHPDFILAPGEMIWGQYRPSADSGIPDPAYPNSTPGGNPYIKTGYTYWYGTSMATPIVAGSAAMLWRFSPKLSAAELRTIIETSAHDMGENGWDYETGYGRLDTLAAYRSIVDGYYDYTPSATVDPLVSDAIVSVDPSAERITITLNENLDSLYVRLNAGNPSKLVPTADDPLSYVLSPGPGVLLDGTNTLVLDMLDLEGNRVSASKSFTYALPASVPTTVSAQPTETIRPDATATDYRISFAPVPGATRYEIRPVSLGFAGTTVDSSEATLPISDLASGYLYSDLFYYIRAGNALGWGEWTTLCYNISPKVAPKFNLDVVPYMPPSPVFTMLLKKFSKPSTTGNYGDRMTFFASPYVEVAGSIDPSNPDSGGGSYVFQVPGIRLLLERSYDRKHWTTLEATTTAMGTDGFSTGEIDYNFKSLRSGYYRVRSIENEVALAAVSDVISFKATPKLSKPVVAGVPTQHSWQSMTVHSTPRLARGYDTMAFKIYRMRTGKWKLFRTIKVHARNSTGGGSNFILWRRLSPGEYKIVPQYLGNSRFGALTLGTVYRSVFF